MCKELGTTPRGGGLLDQPADEIALLDKVFEAMDAHQKRLADKEKRLGRKRGNKGDS